LVPGWFVWRTA